MKAQDAQANITPMSVTLWTAQPLMSWLKAEGEVEHHIHRCDARGLPGADVLVEVRRAGFVMRAAKVELPQNKYAMFVTPDVST